MNGLKKFQEFALNADEQKSVKGGRLVAGDSWTCYLFAEIGDSVTAGATFNTINGALNYCSTRPRCAGCF